MDGDYDLEWAAGLEVLFRQSEKLTHKTKFVPAKSGSEESSPMLMGLLRVHSTSDFDRQTPPNWVLHPLVLRRWYEHEHEQEHRRYEQSEVDFRPMPALKNRLPAHGMPKRTSIPRLWQSTTERLSPAPAHAPALARIPIPSAASFAAWVRA